MGAHASSASASASSALVSADWLDAHRDDVQIVDASWHMPDLKRNGAREHARTRLTPQTVFFDVDKVSDGRNPAPHMLPSAKAFEAACEAVKLTETKPTAAFLALRARRRKELILLLDCNNDMLSCSTSWIPTATKSSIR